MRKRQRGMVLLVMIGLISIMAIVAYVSGLNRSAANMVQTRSQKTTMALARAKEALIAYAMTYNDIQTDRVPGYLPCPDPGNKEGEAVSPCGNSFVSVMGKLPWKTLGLDTLHDGSGECLWYAVSGSYKNYPNKVSESTTTSNMMNWDNNGQFKIFAADGTTLLAGSSEDNQAVAVIFAPGTALPGQDRTPIGGSENCGGNYTAAAYLESTNGINNSTLVTPSTPGAVTNVSSFIAGANGTRFNDQLVFITRADIWNAIKKRTDFNNQLRALTRSAAECVANYVTKNGGNASDKSLPWASAVSLSTTSLPTYAVNASYSDIDQVLAGRLPFRVNNSSDCPLTESQKDEERNEDKDKDKDEDKDKDKDKDKKTKKDKDKEQPWLDNWKFWHDHWKDHLFYAVADSFSPRGKSGSRTCPTCVSVKAQTTTLEGDYAALVIFAGEKLSGQSRNTATDKGKVANYLEGSSPASIDAKTSGGAAYPFQVSLSGSFNDIVYAIDTTLAVKCFNGSAMVSVPVVAPGASLAAYAACP